jgi:ATP-dependent Clp protease ATP-binding subunit ClpA
MVPKLLPLDAEKPGEHINSLQKKLKAEVIGQDEEIDKIIRLIEAHILGYNDPNVPVGVVLALGSTGVGKSFLVSKLAECLYENPKAFIQVNCADFKDSFQTNRFIGAPPGYAGFKEKGINHILSQDKLDSFHTDQIKLTIVLLDEIEKANNSLYEYFLAIFNDGEGRVAGNVVSFSNTLFIMTSNLGATNVSRVKGFSETDPNKHLKDLTSSTMSAVKKHFSPEFINRIDEICMFKPLSKEMIEKIFTIQINKIRRRLIVNKKVQPLFTFYITNNAKTELLKLGFDPDYGARPLLRVLKKHVINKLASLTSSYQVDFGDVIVIDIEEKSFTYKKYDSSELSLLTEEEWADIQKK